MNATVEAWNTAIGLGQPTLDEWQKRIGVKTVVPAFSHAPDLLYGGNNILIAMPLGQPVKAPTKVQSVSAILVSDFFQNALVATIDLPALQIFNISTAISADEFRKSLQEANVGPLQLASEPGIWIIGYAGALLFRFRSLQPNGTDPQNSKLIELRFNYRVPYTSARRPSLAAFSQ
jgi:hypothetical protein